MDPKENSGTEIPAEEVVALGTDENSAPKSASEGEYREETQQAMSAMKAHYGEDISREDGEYTDKLENMVATDLLPKANKLKSYDEANTKLMAMMESEPGLSGILQDMSKGATFDQAYQRNLAPKDPSEVPDDTDIADWEANAKIREDRYKAKQDRQAELDANEEKAIQTVVDFVKEKKLEGEDASKFGKMVADFLDRAYSGEITSDFLEAMYYYLSRDSELAQAEKVGETKGKNAKIVQTKFDAEDYAGDELPVMSGSGGGSPDSNTPEIDPFVKNLNQHLDGQGSILNRG